jgi:diguanylate cyclase (GGDEF)-like protein/PAS domain S-box-containing protein
MLTRASELSDPDQGLVEASAAILSLTADGRIVSWNAAAVQTFGFAEDEACGSEYALIFTEEDVASGRPMRDLLTALKHGVATTERWHVRKDGGRVWCSDTLLPLRDASGMGTGFTAIVLDATERHLAAVRLHERDVRRNALIEGVNDYAIFSIDPDGIIQLWSSGAERLFGYREEEVLGEHYSLVYTPEMIDRGIPAAELEAVERDGHALDEGWHVRRGGEIFYASGRMTRLAPGADGTPRGFVKIVQDITVRHEADVMNAGEVFRDRLTGLPNRAFFTDALRRAIARTKRHPENRFAVIMIDLDGFKVLAESLGALRADGLLVHVARMLERFVRPDDIVARLGGDEFAVLVSEQRGPADAVLVAERIQSALQVPFELDGFEITATAAIGIAASSAGSDGTDSVEAVLLAAEAATRQAKTQGPASRVLAPRPKPAQ